jgi:RNA polymerase sigma-70 factor, ECF subfamily
VRCRTPELPRADLRAVVEATYRCESRRVLATLIRLLGDFDLAEEALQDAFRAALEQWPREGVPAQPRAWLVSTGRFKAIDQIRRHKRFDSLDDHAQTVEKLAAPVDAASNANSNETELVTDLQALADDPLRLIFTCCHPALSPDAQVALTLREVCGLTTEAIAHAFLTPAPTLAQRIVRAKAKIRQAKIPYRVPDAGELAQRLQAVLQVLYLVFNEGYSATTGPALLRTDLSSEAIRVTRLLGQLLPKPEVHGLLALMLLQESRRAARTTPAGDLVLLEDQDRNLWDHALIAEGLALVEQVLRGAPPGVYGLQAAIAALHTEAPSAAATDWPQIVLLYERLMALDDSAVVQLNHAVAVALRDGPLAGLALMDALQRGGQLGDYHLLHSARGALLTRLRRQEEAAAAYRRALELTTQVAERRFLQGRLEALSDSRD